MSKWNELSTRARRVLQHQGYDLTNVNQTRLRLRKELVDGVQWRNCGKKTMKELLRWMDDPDSLSLSVMDGLLIAGAISVLKDKGYTVTPPPTPF